MLSELITLLTCGDLQGKELANCASRVTASPMDPELAWIDGQHPGEYMQFALLAELGDYYATGATVDELHQEVSEQFADPLPDVPDAGLSVPGYFQWLDGVLASRATAYQLLRWGGDFDDNLYTFIVRRGDTPRILALAAELGLEVEPAAASS